MKDIYTKAGSIAHYKRLFRNLCLDFMKGRIDNEVFVQAAENYKTIVEHLRLRYSGQIVVLKNGAYYTKCSVKQYHNYYGKKETINAL